MLSVDAMVGCSDWHRLTSSPAATPPVRRRKPGLDSPGFRNFLVMMIPFPKHKHLHADRLAFFSGTQQSVDGCDVMAAIREAPGYGVALPKFARPILHFPRD